MGGVWVFPGGAVDAEEGDGDAAHRLAAVRELHEEAVDRARGTRTSSSSSRAGSRRPWSRSASTPTSSSPRCPTARSRRSTARSASTSAGSRPQGALEAHAAGEILLVFPTIKHLEQLGEFATVGDAAGLRPRHARCCPSSRASWWRARSPGSCCRARRATRGRSGRDRSGRRVPGPPERHDLRSTEVAATRPRVAPGLARARRGARSASGAGAGSSIRRRADAAAAPGREWSAGSARGPAVRRPRWR